MTSSRPDLSWPRLNPTAGNIAGLLSEMETGLTAPEIRQLGLQG